MMNEEELNYDPKDLFGLLIAKVVDLETELVIQSALLKALAIRAVGNEQLQLLEAEAESFRHKIRTEQ